MPASIARAHWCSNIWTAASRLIVKPERDTVYVGSVPTQFRVYLQNSLPMRLFGIRMSGSATGYSVSVAPSAGLTIYPGQNAGFTFSVSKTGAPGSVSVSTLNLQVYFDRVGWVPGFTDCLTEGANQAKLANGVPWGVGYCHATVQSSSLNAALLGEKFPSYTLGAGQPFFGRNGIQQAIHHFGYRFCYSMGGGWRCGSNNCPSPCSDLAQTHWASTDQFAQNCMRAGIEVAIRRASLGSQLAPARDAAVNALKGGGSAEHKCIAAVAGAYLWVGGSSSTFTTELKSGANSVPAGCIAAADRILGNTGALTCSSYSSYYEVAACAAAEGIQGNDTQVKNVLMAFNGDGNQGGRPADGTGDYPSLYWGYMLALVTAHRTASGSPSYYPDAGGPLLGDAAPPQPDTKPAADTKPVIDMKKSDTKPAIDMYKADGKKVDALKQPDMKKVDASKQPDMKKIDAPKPKPDAPKPKTDTKPAGDVAPKQDTVAPDGVAAADTAGPGEGAPASDAVRDSAKAKADSGSSDKLDGGCGCRLDRPAAPASWPALVLLLVGLALTRRRR
jgi:MYXO-CTERM domain-containing protein